MNLSYTDRPTAGRVFSSSISENINKPRISAVESSMPGTPQLRGVYLSALVFQPRIITTATETYEGKVWTSGTVGKGTTDDSEVDTVKQDS